ncbi:unnamed protein product [Somion occarium]|uniref:Protein arginine N-methyltransferase n=1 Tax=Somion occarium TaxID=3059160 RepID=A0ABP1EAM9_9APHY
MSSFIAHVSLQDLSVYTTPPSSSPASSASATTTVSTGETPVLRAASDARSKGYEAIAIPLTNDKWKARWSEMCLLPTGDIPDRQSLEGQAEAWRSNPAFMRNEVTITRLDEAEGVVAFASEWLELDASDDWVRHDAETALLQELAYASYLNVHAVILPSPRNRAHVASFARAVNAALKAIPYMQLSVRIPIYDRSLMQLAAAASGVASPNSPGTSSSPNGGKGNPFIGSGAGEVSDQPSIASWEMWDTIRTICEYNVRLSLTLDLTPPLPADLAVLRQWVAEPTRFLFLPVSTFIANAKGYPVLPKPTQKFTRDIMKIQPNVILSGTSSGRHAKGGEAAYSQYVRHLEKTSPSVKAAHTPGTVENFAQGYQDYLQAPLQPLMDNLQSVTYQTFEQDPVKYRNYEEAIFRALSEWPRPGRIVICVAGAGRGPLVARCLTAIERAKKEAFVYAVEKNPNALVTLQDRLRLEWGDKVKILFGDMRTLEVPEQVDILVSELLGSFGDNELSPECLDGAMRFLKPDGISIPASYTAHLAPLSSSKLYNETRVSKDEKAVETPYVVMFQSINILSGDGGGVSGECGPQVQECWEFEHPRRDAVLNAQGLPFTNSHNTRFAKLTFHIPHASVLHGFGGYFEAVLYGSVGLSIHPQRMDKISKDMLSWFPLFFPLKPLYLPSNCELHVSIWRLTNERHVWYEWHAEAFLPLPVLLDGELSQERRRKGTSSLSATPSIAASSLADADDTLFVSSPSRIMFEPLQEEPSGARFGLIKIGQTALHNPRGRSSWIGL